MAGERHNRSINPIGKARAHAQSHSVMYSSFSPMFTAVTVAETDAVMHADIIRQ